MVGALFFIHSAVAFIFFLTQIQHNRTASVRLNDVPHRTAITPAKINDVARVIKLEIL